LLPAAGSNFIWAAESKVISPSAAISKCAASPSSSTVVIVVAPFVVVIQWAWSPISSELWNNNSLPPSSIFKNKPNVVFASPSVTVPLKAVLTLVPSSFTSSDSTSKPVKYEVPTFVAPSIKLA